jgi:hypothetical protein
MNTEQPNNMDMRKYYVGLAALSLVIVVVVVAALVREIPLRHDKVLRNQINQASNAIEQYAHAHNNVAPSDLDQIYVNGVPDSITYDHPSSQTYVLCATFKRSFNYPNNGTGASKSPSADQEIQRLQERHADAHYHAINTYGEFSHVPGKNCYVGTVATTGKRL